MGTFWPKPAQQIQELEERWATDPRWRGIKRDYSAADVVKLRGSLKVEHSLAKAGAERLWTLLNEQPYVATFGAMTGAQAAQMVKAGLQAIYMSGWQVAGDANTAGQTYPDQSLYPANSVPTLVKRLNNALMRADQIHTLEGKNGVYWYAPIVADAEAGFGGAIHAFELMRNMIEAGAAGVHYEDQLAAEKKCGHMGGKVLVPTAQFIRTLNAARLAADVLDTPTLLVARTDSLDAKLLTSDIDLRDRPFLTGARTAEGFFEVTGGMGSTIARGLAFAPYADMLWFETSHPDLAEAEEFADAIHERFPGKIMAYNCSPSFNWRAKLDEDTIARFRGDLARMGYKFQFITLAGWHMVNLNAFEFAQAFRDEGMPAYVRIQDREFSLEEDGYTATKHQQEVGAGYFDQVALTVSGGEASTTALVGSTEAGQFR
ncbi:MAG: isocitrate lyase [Chloroflexi bacterium]|nr:isocitrate lyase [Chloroflexota bacterium]